MILVLAGTAEARALCGALAEANIPVMASLAGATTAPKPLGVGTRIGGFGGGGGFVKFIKDNGVVAVVDATHPFSVRITERTARLCAEQGVPYLRLERPLWRPESGDRWHEVGSAAEAIKLIPREGKVFLATGRQSLGDFAGLKTQEVYARVVDEPLAAFPFAKGQFIVGRPPFDLASETALFALLGIDWLVVKNAGGSGRAKLDAARDLGVDVVMITRPPLVEMPVVETVDEALDWVRGL